MYTQCPHCHTVFNVTAAQLKAADGEVRCGECKAAFDGVGHILDHLPEVPGAAPAAAAGFDPSLDLGVAAPADGAPPRVSPFGALLGRLKGGEGPAGGGRATLGWAAGSLLLILLLGVQWIYHQRDALAEEPAMRPWLERLCAVTGCRLPAHRDLAQLSLEEREVRSHPTAQGALLMEGVILNQAPFAQPFPLLEVRLSDLTGRPVALRRFQPREYLSHPGAAVRDLPAGGSAAITLEVVDPGKEAVSFEFDFL